MHEGVLPNVDRGDMKTEGFDTAQQPGHGEQSGVSSLVRAQAIGYEFDILEEFLRRLVGESVVVVGCLQPGRNEPQEYPIRHLSVSCRNCVCRL